MNVIRFLDNHNINYVDFGSNVKQGNINISCPFCGDDPSEHMGISLKAPYVYGCWRNVNHRGKNIENLVKELIDCSWSEAKRLVLEDSILLEKESSVSKILSIFKTSITIDKQVSKVELLKEFRELSAGVLYKRFYDYLYDRGFSYYDTDRLVEYYKLKCTYSGSYSWRIIIPIYYENKLVTWTSRTIRNDDPLRYKNLSFEKSIMRSTDCLYDFDNLIKREGKMLLVFEGPFDVFNSYKFGVPATCIFTLNMSYNQQYLLFQFAKVYEKVAIVLDKGFFHQAKEMRRDLSYIKNIYTWSIPDLFDANDVGEMCKEEFQLMISKI